MTALDWLNASMGVRRQNNMPHLSSEPTILQYLAELIYVNGGSMVVKGFGNVQLGIGAYGRIGLKIDEAFHLCELTGTLNGLMIACDGNQTIKDATHTLIQEEINRVEKEFLDLNAKALVIPTPDDVKNVEQSRIIMP